MKKENIFVAIFTYFKKLFITTIDKDGSKKEKATRYVEIAADKLPIKAEKKIRTKTVIAIISALTLCVMVFFILKISSNAKENYEAYNTITPHNTENDKTNKQERKNWRRQLGREKLKEKAQTDFFSKNPLPAQ